jgi:hypothetical protein
MKAPSGNKAFEYSFVVFIILLSISLFTSLYLDASLTTWSRQNFKQSTQDIVSLIDNSFNSYKLSAYGMMSASQTAYKTSPKLLISLFQDPQTLDLLGKVSNAYYVTSTETYFLTKQVNAADSTFAVIKNTSTFSENLTKAFSENRPTFFSNPDQLISTLGMIIPISSSDQAYVYTSFKYQDLLLPVFKTQMLEGINKVGVLITTDHPNQSTVLYQSDDYSVATSVAKKTSQPDQLNYTVAFDSNKLNLRFTEYRTSPCKVLTKKITYTTLGIGIILSIIAFAASYIGMTFYQSEKS